MNKGVDSLEAPFPLSLWLDFFKNKFRNNQTELHILEGYYFENQLHLLKCLCK